MADIEETRRNRGAAIWITGLLILALTAWGIYEWLDDDTELATTEIEEPLLPAPAPGGETPADQVTLVPVLLIVTTPADYAGRSVRGTAEVAEVVSDRGFWIEQEGRRLFVIIDEPVPENTDINAGQTLELTATVYTPATLDQVPGQLEQETRSIAQKQPAFLYARAADIRITERPSR